MAVSIEFDVEYADADDWLAFAIKKAEDSAMNCPASECTDENGWISIDLRGGSGSVSVNPGYYYYKFEAGNTAGNKVIVKYADSSSKDRKIPITIGSGNKTVGCSLLKI